VSGWPTVSLGSVIDIERVGRSPEQIMSGTSYIGLEHITGAGEIIDPPVVQAGDLASQKFAFSDQHVLYGKLRPYLRKIARPNFSGICSTDILPLRPRAGLDRGYLFHFLRTDVIVQRASSLSTGINLPRISSSRLAEFEISLPPLDEQRRIAAILDQADRLREGCRRGLRLLASAQRNLFIDQFVRDSVQWPEEQVSNLCREIRTGPFGSQLLHSEFVSEGVAVLGIDNVVSNEFTWSDRRYISSAKYAELVRYTVSPGDILITIMGTCGRSVVVPDDIPLSINTKHLCCMTPDKDKVTADFLRAAFLEHPSVRRQLGEKTKGAVMPGLNMAIIKNLKIPVPPLKMQHVFGDRLRALADLAAKAHAQAEQMDTLFASLQHRAFAGEL
jgi:type I restriction enzyme S subunit